MQDFVLGKEARFDHFDSQDLRGFGQDINTIGYNHGNYRVGADGAVAAYHGPVLAAGFQPEEPPGQVAEAPESLGSRGGPHLGRHVAVNLG